MNLKSYSQARRTRTGFTLIELLTVIAIIGILAAILIPVVGSVRDSARGAQCLSNIRQVGITLLMYADDHNRLLPPPVQTDNQTTWNETLVEEGYLGNETTGSVFVCPSFDPYVYPDDPVARSRVYGMRVAHSSVSATPQGGSAEHRQTNLDALTDPGRYVLMGDTYSTPGGTPSQWYLFYAAQVANVSTPALHARHKGRLNIGYADGSVALVDPADLTDPSRPSSERFSVRLQD